MLELQEVSIIDQTAEYVRHSLYGDSSGHDWWHVHRVWSMAKNIQSAYSSVDTVVIELAALLHDIADWKKYNGDHNVGPATAKRWLTQMQGIDQKQIEHVCVIIKNISFKGINSKRNKLSLEGQIVQDADRLDAMGAIGIARTFAYGGHKGRLMHDPTVKHVNHTDETSYLKNTGTTINHFYEKLLLIKDLMNTEPARKIAKERHEFMINYLEQFYAEWDGLA